MTLERILKSKTLMDDRGEVSLFLVGERVGADPGVWDGDAGSDAQAGQVGGQGALQQVGGPAHGVLRLAHVQALGKEARVVGCQGRRERNGRIANEPSVGGGSPGTKSESVKV